MSCLVGVAMVDVRQFGRVANKQERRSDSHHGAYSGINDQSASAVEDPVIRWCVACGTIFLRQSIHGWQLSLAKVVPCDPKPGHSSPEGPGEDRQRVEKVIVDNLIHEFEQNIRHKT